MDQKVPVFSIEDVNRIITREFPRESFDMVFSILMKYSGEGSKNGRYRVWIDAIRNSSKNIERLRNQIEIAIIDYRDVISKAEYPEYTDKISFGGAVSKLFEKEVIQRDYVQYEKWVASK
ncbi:MAG: hypothetical protein J0L75_07330 [Spirochaetes bacterium]|nr:hypothetical protein [Spirochaetota bacterium]